MNNPTVLIRRRQFVHHDAPVSNPRRPSHVAENKIPKGGSWKGDGKSLRAQILSLFPFRAACLARNAP